ncbi:hypothetical protein TCE0_039r12756 [Talaromyces pinophilus]|uniref:Uncharacterized protein n=1 Tax=Talaromyces pinophilus TaxID=128442 RepID=A0A6N4SL19_TALPI|nr:hypothetical protein TCE0_039r12756 [Talaromyces pinophilus]
MKVRRVAVIGAGPAGAIATDALVKEQTFDTVRVFERQDVAGGSWVLTPSEKEEHKYRLGIPSLEALIKQRADIGVPIPKDVYNGVPVETAVTEEVNSPRLRFAETAIHEDIHTKLPPESMGFSKEPIPITVPPKQDSQSRHGPDSILRPRGEIRAWINSVFKRYGHDKLIEFGTTVESAEYIDTEDKQGKEWVLTLRKLVSTKAGIKNLWWQERFDAVVVASGHYHLPAIPDIPGLIEYDKKYPGKITHSKYYRRANHYAGKRVIVIGGSNSAFDIVHAIRETAKSPVIAAVRTPSRVYGTIPFLLPKVDLKSHVISFDAAEDKITLADGSVINGGDIDVIIFATGYDFSIPFIPEMKSVHKRIPGLYRHIFWKENPTLTFIGMITGVLGVRYFEWQAVAAARVLAGRVQLSDHSVMDQWEKTRLAERGDGMRFWTLHPDIENHFEELRAFAGEPAPGSTGRVLPKYEKEWEDVWWRLIKNRQEWWAKIAEEAKEPESS